MVVSAVSNPMGKLFLIFYFLNQLNLKCLSAETLQALNLNQLQTSATRIEDSRVCKEIYKDYGTCISTFEVQEYLSKN